MYLPGRVWSIVIALVVVSLGRAHPFDLEDPGAWAPRATRALGLAIDLQDELPAVSWNAGDAEAWWAALTIGLGLDVRSAVVSAVAVRLRQLPGDDGEALASDADIVFRWRSDVQDLVWLATYGEDPDGAPAGFLPAVGWVSYAAAPPPLRAALDRLVAVVARGRP